jgi:PBP1b-binding outer membrane lipoprotein LpoB
MKTTILAILALAILTGCASPAVKVDVDKAYAAYIEQQRTFAMICALAGILILCRTMDHDNDD